MSRRPILIAVVAILLVAAGGGGYLLRDRLTRSVAAPIPSSPQAASGLALAEALQHGLRGRRPARASRGRASGHDPAGEERGVARTLPRGNDDPFFRDFFNQFFGSEGPGLPLRVPPARPGIGRHHRQARPRPHQLPRRQGRRRDPDPPVRQARIPRTDPRNRPENGPRGRQVLSRTTRSRSPAWAIRTRSGWASGPSPSATRSAWTRP